MIDSEFERPVVINYSQMVFEALTLDILKQLNTGIFAFGTNFIRHPWFNNCHKFIYNEKGQPYIGDPGYGLAAQEGYKYAYVKWVAIKLESPYGWKLYHSLDGNLEPADFFDGISHLKSAWAVILRHGAKLRDPDELHKILKADKEALREYGY